MITFNEESDKLDIRDGYRIGYLRSAMADTFPHQSVYWDRQGMRRRIPFSVIANALRLYDDSTHLVEAHIIIELPEEAYTLRWEQTQ